MNLGPIHIRKRKNEVERLQRKNEVQRLGAPLSGSTNNDTLTINPNILNETLAMTIFLIFQNKQLTMLNNKSNKQDFNNSHYNNSNCVL